MQRHVLGLRERYCEYDGRTEYILKDMGCRLSVPILTNSVGHGSMQHLKTGKLHKNEFAIRAHFFLRKFAC